MQTPNPNMEQQTPRQNAEERLAEASPAMMFPRMIETIHLNRQRKNHRRQIEHDRAAQAAVLRGEKVPEWSLHDERDEDEDGMGDSFSIAGDTHHYHQPPPAEHASSPQPRSKVSDLIKGGLLTAAIASGPIGVGAGYWLSQRHPQAQPQDEQVQAKPQQVMPWHLYPGYKVHPPPEDE